MAELNLQDDFNELISANEKLADSLLKTTTNSKKMNDAVNKGATGVRHLRNQGEKTAGTFTKLNRIFSIARSRMLIVSFAVRMLTAELRNMAREAAKLNSVARAFDTLSGGVGQSAIAMEKLKKATNGTMSEMDLFKQANNAMILGVSRNSSEMAEMFDIAQRLGRALGKDTTESVESLITGIGRQSRLMLDNIGIIVKADEAYQDYADILGKSASNLTDAEKKQAFLNATMESARAKVKSLGSEVLSQEDQYQQLETSIKEFRVEIGEFLLPNLIELVDFSKQFLVTWKNIFGLANQDKGPVEIERWVAGFEESEEKIQKELEALKARRKEIQDQQVSVEATTKSNEALNKTFSDSAQSFEIVGMVRDYGDALDNIVQQIDGETNPALASMLLNMAANGASME